MGGIGVLSGGGVGGGGGGGRHWQRPPSLMSWQTVGAKYGTDLEEKDV